MYLTAKQIAVKATLEAFLNCYIREVNNGNWVKTEDWIKENLTTFLITGNDIVELELPIQGRKYAFEIFYKSKVGKHVVGITLKYCSKKHEWEREDSLVVILTFIQELHLMARRNGCDELASHTDELILRLIESYQTMTRYVEESMAGTRRAYATFIESEQSLVFGHWFHPTPKSRQGMSNWQQQSYAPELKGKFQLHYFEVDKKMITESSSVAKSASDIILQSVMKYIPDFQKSEEVCILPMHPLQAQSLLQQEEMKKALQEGTIVNIGVLGPYYSATSSIRTVYCTEEEYMYKFSIPVKVTNSLRKNQQHELKAGVVMSRLLQKLLFLDNHPSFSMIEDPAYITVDFPHMRESGFEVIIRSNIFTTGKDKGITSIAAIVQDPFPNQRSMLKEMIMTNAQVEDRSVKEVSLDWFDKYWSCSIEPIIRLYDDHGIALEAHQQNSLVDISTGYPERYYYRDNQGYYLSKSHEQVLILTEPRLIETPDLFYEDELIQERFTYYLIVNQLFSVIYRFGADQMLEETDLIELTVQKLSTLEKELKGQGKGFVQSLIHGEMLPHKANLLTRFHDVDELTAELEQSIYQELANPFVVQRKEEEYENALSYTF
ncbi:IucA/IucC family protein [Litchfieldia salsa]|uniref:Siderophore synthetase component n=1 Tax=Litchfieldia salsa TaxID=930152 RepID=A0A1H0S0V0_9BACI|nr:IucA/IucC family protein [Litchfieldia salsa]SDP35461.1 Siderophore synthetase component [Litchfieldia salsa]